MKAPPITPHPKPPCSGMDGIEKHHKMDTHTVFSPTLVNIAIPASGLLGIAFAVFLWTRVAQIKVRGGAAVRSENGREYLLEEEQRGESEVST